MSLGVEGVILRSTLINVPVLLLPSFCSERPALQIVPRVSTHAPGAPFLPRACRKEGVVASGSWPCPAPGRGTAVMGCSVQPKSGKGVPKAPVFHGACIVLAGPGGSQLSPQLPAEASQNVEIPARGP